MDNERKPQPLDPLEPLLSIGDPTADIDALHLQALSDIKARGEDPEELLAEFDRSLMRLAAAHLPARRAVGALSDARFLDLIAPPPADEIGAKPLGRPAELGDVFGSIGLDGKIIARVSGWTTLGDGMRDGDTILVDPSAQIGDGDIALACINGHGLVVKRLRIVRGECASLESADFNKAPIAVDGRSGLRVYGKVVWRGGEI